MKPIKLRKKLLRLIRKKRLDKLFEARDPKYPSSKVLKKEYHHLFKNYLKDYGKYSLDLPDEFIFELYEQTESYKLWTYIIYINSNPLPPEIGKTLCKSYEVSRAISNSFQDISVYFAAAERTKYARSRLCIRLFIEEQYTVQDLEKYINMYGRGSAVRILRHRRPSSEEKYSLFTSDEIALMKEEWNKIVKLKSRQRFRKKLKRKTRKKEWKEEREKIEKRKQ